MSMDGKFNKKIDNSKNQKISVDGKLGINIDNLKFELEQIDKQISDHKLIKPKIFGIPFWQEKLLLMEEKQDKLQIKIKNIEE